MLLPGLCVLFLFSVAVAAVSVTCDDSKFRNLPFCDASLSFDERAADLISRMTPEQMASQMNMAAPAIPSLGIDFFNYGGEALHGLWSSCLKAPDGSQRCPTQFPAPILLGASFNRSLWRLVGAVSSSEARAMFMLNVSTVPPAARSLEGPLGLMYYAPNINLARDQRWGRVEEVPSEDPFVNGEYGFAFTNGFQRDAEAPASSRDYIRAGVVCKHFAVYNLEKTLGAPPVTRHAFNAVASARDLEESYLPMFARCVDASAAAIMCSYNAINGVPACLDQSTLVDVLRTNWSFEGVVATDCGAINDAFAHHRFSPNLTDAVHSALEASVDSNCGSAFHSELPKLIQSGRATALRLSQSARRLMVARFRLGLFDNATLVPWWNTSLYEVDSPAHRAGSLDAAEQGMTLLKNDDSVLPLDVSSLRTIALVGPMASASKNMLSGYSGTPPSDTLVSPYHALLQALKSRGSDTQLLYSPGVSANSNNTGGISAAVAAARASDIVVVGLGLCGNNYPSAEDPMCDATINEAEGIERSSVALPGKQMQLVQALASVGKPIVVFLMTAGSVDVAALKESPIVKSILWVGYPGEMGGIALANVLLGAVSPSGALPSSWLPQSYYDLVKVSDMVMRPQGASVPGRTYRFLAPSTDPAVTPIWPFGFSMSYSEFVVDDWHACASNRWTLHDSFILPVHANATAHFCASVRNVGRFPAAKIVLGFVSVLRSSVPDPPVKQLFDFTRTKILSPGESTTISLALGPTQRSLVNVRGTRVQNAPGWAFQVYLGGDASGAHSTAAQLRVV